jgi:hypothetical protein
VSKVTKRELKDKPPENEAVWYERLRLSVADGSHGNARNLQLSQHGQLHFRHTLTACGFTCVKLFYEFCDRSTLHGLKYIGDKNLHFLER